MGRELRATVRVKQDELTGKQMIFPAESPPGAVVVYLEIDNRKCEITRDVECFSSGTGVSKLNKKNLFKSVFTNCVYSLF